MNIQEEKYVLILLFPPFCPLPSPLLFFFSSPPSLPSSPLLHFCLSVCDYVSQKMSWSQIQQESASQNKPPQNKCKLLQCKFWSSRVQGFFISKLFPGDAWKQLWPDNVGLSTILWVTIELLLINANLGKHNRLANQEMLTIRPRRMTFQSHELEW